MIPTNRRVPGEDLFYATYRHWRATKAGERRHEPTRKHGRYVQANHHYENWAEATR